MHSATTGRGASWPTTSRRLLLLGAALAVGFVGLLLLLFSTYVTNRDATSEHDLHDVEQRYALQLQLALTDLHSRQLAYVIDVMETGHAHTPPTSVDSDFVQARNLVEQALAQPPDTLTAPGSPASDKIIRLKADFDKFKALDHELNATLSSADVVSRETRVLRLLDRAQLVTSGMVGLADRIDDDVQRTVQLSAERVQRARTALRATGMVFIVAMTALLAYGGVVLARFMRTNAALVRELEQQSYEDPLTGAANRRAWNAILDRQMHLSRAVNGQLAVAVVDLDRFKQFNDQHGHAKGDELLQRFVECCANGLRNDDLIARLGGEEFAVLMAGATSAELARRLEDVRAAYHRFGTFSAGVSSLRDGDTVHSLVERADQAMYHAKDSGRDRICLDTGTRADPWAQGALNI